MSSIIFVRPVNYCIYPLHIYFAQATGGVYVNLDLHALDTALPGPADKLAFV